MAASGNVGMISWNRRVLQARANLNGGELDGGYQVTILKKGGKMVHSLGPAFWCTPSDRPKWRRAGCSALRNGEEGVKDQLRTSLNGGKLVRSTFVVLTFARALAFVASFILVFVFAFLSPFGSEIFAFLFCNGEKRGIWSQCWITSCETFGRVFASAHGDLWRRVTFHRSSRKAGVNCVQRRRWKGRRCCWGGWLTLWWAERHANGS